MSAATLILIIVSVTISALAQASFKLGMSTAARNSASYVTALTSPGVIGGLLLYAVGTLLWLRVLSRVDLSQAYPFVGLGFVITSLIGVLAFGEVITAARSIGVAFVIVGVFVIARS